MGGYHCECNEGYEITTDHMTCIGKDHCTSCTLHTWHVVDCFQTSMSALPLMVVVLTTVSTLMEVMSVPVEMGLHWERTACLVKT